MQRASLFWAIIFLLYHLEESRSGPFFFFFFLFWCMGVFFSSLLCSVLHVQFLAHFKSPPPQKMERMNKDMHLEHIYKTETDSQT